MWDGRCPQRPSTPACVAFDLSPDRRDTGVTFREDVNEGLRSQRYRQHVADHGRLAVWCATNHFDQIFASLGKPRVPHAIPLAAAIEKLVAASSRDPQPQTPGWKPTDGGAKTVARVPDHDVGVSTDFRNPSATLHCPSSSSRKCDQPRIAETRGRITEGSEPRNLVLTLCALGDHATAGERHNALGQKQRVLGSRFACNGLATFHNGAAQVGGEHHVIHLLERVSIPYVDGIGPLEHRDSRRISHQARYCLTVACSQCALQFGCKSTLIPHTRLTRATRRLCADGHGRDCNGSRCPGFDFGYQLHKTRHLKRMPFRSSGIRLQKYPVTRT